MVCDLYVRRVRDAQIEASPVNIPPKSELAMDLPKDTVSIAVRNA